MKKDSKGNPKKPESEDDVPPGGKAYERIQQDRLQRGLPPLPEPGKEPGTQPRFAKKRKARANK
jgi:hypothetical protein